MSQQSVALLKKQVFQLSHELELQKIQNQNLLSEIVQLKQKQQKLKQINDVLAENLNKSQKQVNDQITLKIEGQFLTKRIVQLQQELQKYKSGVSDSVDRRVKKIVNQYTQEKQIQYEKRKSRLSLGYKAQISRKTYLTQNHEHKHYNIYHNQNSDLSYPDSQKTMRKLHRNNSNPVQSCTGSDIQQSLCTPYQINIHNKVICQNCSQISKVIEQKDEVIQKLQDQLRSLYQQFKQQQSKTNMNQFKNSQVDDQWRQKYEQLFDIYENLRKQHDLLLDQYNNLTSTGSNHKQNYTINQTPTQGFKKKQLFMTGNSPNIYHASQSRLIQKSGRDRQQQMLQQITNLVNGLGKNKKSKNQQNDRSISPQYIDDKKSKVSNMSNFRNSQQINKIDGSFFTIKQGVNRYGNKHNLL